MGYIYVLKLKQDKWYVGYSNNLKERLKSHFAGKSASWVKEYPAVKVDCIIKQVPSSAERLVTLLYMLDKGWQNVRGGAWSQTTLRCKPKAICSKEERRRYRAASKFIKQIARLAA